MAMRQLTALPVFNEEAHLLDVLPEVRKYSQDVLVVDDGSTDRTSLLLSEMDGITVIRHNPNQGYGGGLRTAFNYAIEHGYDQDGKVRKLLVEAGLVSVSSRPDLSGIARISVGKYNLE